MLHILLNYGIPEEIANAIANMCDNPSSFVQTLDGPTNEFFTTTGILPADTLAPYLFVIVVDYLLRQSKEALKSKGIDMLSKTSREKDKYLTDLDYADDIALTAMLLQDAQHLLESLEDASAKVGLFLNAKKTEYMSIRGNECPASILSRDGTQLKEVDDFKYLGSLLPTVRKTSLLVKLKLGKPTTNYTLSGSPIFQGKPSLTSLEHALRVSSYMAAKPGQ